MTGIIGALIPLAVRLIGSFLDRKGADAETRRQWLLFVQKMQQTGLISAQLHDDYQRQLDELRRSEKKDVPSGS